MRSVLDSGGSTLRNTPMNGEVISGLRRNGSSTSALTTARIAAATMTAVGLMPANQQMPSSTAPITVQVTSRMR